VHEHDRNPGAALDVGQLIAVDGYGSDALGKGPSRDTRISHGHIQYKAA
jgi:hypothetical protein